MFLVVRFRKSTVLKALEIRSKLIVHCHPYCSSLNAPQSDAVRMQWEDSQDQSGDVPQQASTAEFEQPRTLRSTKRAKTGAKAVDREEDRPGTVDEAQDAPVNETAEERRTRKGKAPMRPDLRPRRGPVWESVKSTERLVSDEEGSDTHDSDSDVSDISIALRLSSDMSFPGPVRRIR